MTNFFASKADFDRAIQEALAPLNHELKVTKENRDAILAEKRKLEGKTLGRTSEGVIRTESELHVPNEVVKNNPQRYQYFRKLAHDEGLTMRLVEQAPEKSDATMPQVFTNERAHYVSRDYTGQSATKYQEEKAFAEKKGLKFVPFTHASELPAEAFVKE